MGQISCNQCQTQIQCGDEVSFQFSRTSNWKALIKKKHTIIARQTHNIPETDRHVTINNSLIVKFTKNAGMYTYYEQDSIPYLS